MDHFQIHAPTQIIFGKNTENEAGKWCKYYGAHKVLVHFGGHSAKKSGLLDRVCASLKDAGLEYVLLGGVVPNPQLSMVKKGVELCREENVDFILAVGGGSVIDSAKGIGYGLANPGDYRLRSARRSADYCGSRQRNEQLQRYHQRGRHAQARSFYRLRLLQIRYYEP